MRLPASASFEDVAEELERLNADPAVNGILLQLPLPGRIDAAPLTGRILPEKDVDGLTPISTGRLWQGTPGPRPCTPLGVIELLDSYGVTLEGADAVVVGRSNLVGKPVSLLLLQANATVTVCHSRTADLRSVCQTADILVSAVGKTFYIEPDWVTGVSIGAINSAIIAGNSKQWRLKRLRTFWERITERKIWSYTPDGDVFRKARNAASSWLTLIQGQPGFFSPRHPTRGSALPELKVPGAIMTTRRCVRRSKTWSISRCSTKRQCAFRWAR